MGNVLVAYFSVSGVTAKVAKKLANAIEADLFEIKPVVPYTKDDLNWTDDRSRSSIEMADSYCRPEIAETVYLDHYDTIFLGFPIWWYREPSIIDTFLESYDFHGKTIIPFATSGGSDMGDTSKNIEELATGATVAEGKRFSSLVLLGTLVNWANQWIGK